MNKETKNKLVPKLRFPEFKQAGEWDITPLSSALKAESSTLAQNNLQLIENGFPVYGASGFIGFTSSFIQDEDYIAIIKDGSGVGKLFLYKKNSSVLGTLTYLKSQDNATYDLVYLFYLLQTVSLSSYIKGSGIPHIYYSDYAKEVIAIPSHSEQQQIADCLSSLDEYLTTQMQKLEALKAYKKGLMQQLFPAEGEAVPKLRFKEFIGSSEWQEKRLENFVSSLDAGVSVNSGDRSAEEKEIGILKTSCVKDDVFDYTENKVVLEVEEKVRVREPVTKNTIIISRMNTPALVGANAFVEKDHANIFLPDRLWAAKSNSKGSMKFISYILGSDKGRLLLSELAKGTSGSMKNITKSDVLQLVIQVPTLIEQKRIADCLSSLDVLITAQVEKIEELKRHKKGLMQGLFPNVDN